MGSRFAAVPCVQKAAFRQSLCFLAKNQIIHNPYIPPDSDFPGLGGKEEKNRPFVFLEKFV